jgi:hypothetical protein
MPQLKTSISWGIGLNLVKMLAIYLVMVLLFHRPDYFIHFHGDIGFDHPFGKHIALG